jgi:hypothetical protein
MPVVSSLSFTYSIPILTYSFVAIAMNMTNNLIFISNSHTQAVTLGSLPNTII